MSGLNISSVFLFLANCQPNVRSESLTGVFTFLALAMIPSAPILALLSTLLLPLTQCQAACSQGALNDAVSRYMAAQSTGNIKWLEKAVTSDTLYLENSKATDIHKSTLAQPIQIDYMHTIHDLTQCATYTEIISTNPSSPWQIGTQIRLTDNKITTIDRIVTTIGDWAFNATHALVFALPPDEQWVTVPENSRASRQALQ